MTNNTQTSKQIVEGFWVAMQTNDFKAAGEFLHDDYLLEWPQSGERIRGRANFVAVNVNYPAHGSGNSRSIASSQKAMRLSQMWACLMGRFRRGSSHSRQCRLGR